MADEVRKRGEQVEAYEPPRVDDVRTEDGPAVTAPGASYDDTADDQPVGPEWRPEPEQARRG